MKKLIALFMALAMVLCFAACGTESDGGSAKETTPTVVGEWEGSMDMTTAMEGVMTDSLGMEIEMKDLALVMTFEFNKDGSFTCEVDEESAEKLLNNMIDSVVDVLVEALEAEGVDLEAEGMSKEDLRSMMEEEMDMDDLISELAIFEDGYYIYENDCIYTGSDLDALKEDAEANSDEIWEVSLSGKTMKVTNITDANGDSMDDVLPGVLPLTFKKK